MSVIAKNIRHLRKAKEKSQEQMADDLGVTRSRIGSYEESRSEPNIDLLLKLSDYFDLPVDVLIRHDLTKSESPLVKIGDTRILFPITVSEKGEEHIEVVPVKASAGYLEGYGDPEYIEQLPKMQLPFMPSGTHRAFPIQGDSMLPVKPGSYIVGKFVESLQQIRNGQTYVLITKDDGIVYKRVYNKLEESGCLELHSDNKVYDPYTIQPQAVLEAWEFVCNINLNEYSREEINLESVMNMLRKLNVQLEGNA